MSFNFDVSYNFFQYESQSAEQVFTTNKSFVFDFLIFITSHEV